MSLRSIELSTYELASCLALCGYESMASQVLNNIKSNNTDEIVTRFIQHTENSLKLKGYWDKTRPTLLVTGLENLLHLLVQSKKKVRCIKGNHVLFIHLIDKKNVLIQDIKNQKHSFYIKRLDKIVITSLLSNHFMLSEYTSPKIQELQAFLLTEEIYNDIHTISLSNLEGLINDKNLDSKLRGFLSDFQHNNREFDNISLMDMDYIKDYINVKQIIFLLPSENYIWHLDYENILEEEVYIVPTKVSSYVSNSSQVIIDFLNTSC